LTLAGAVISLSAMNFLNRYADTVYCIMRLVVGLLFACHGGQKLLGFPPGGHGTGNILAATAAWIELAGGFLIAFGLITRIAAFVASGEMAVAYFMVHAQMGSFFPVVNKGESAVIYCFVFLFIIFYGPGRLSIDALIGRGRAATTPTA
jgi:putative oxidoreductase